MTVPGNPEIHTLTLAEALQNKPTNIRELTDFDDLTDAIRARIEGASLVNATGDCDGEPRAGDLDCDGSTVDAGEYSRLFDALREGDESS